MKKTIIWGIMALLMCLNVFAFTIVTSEPLQTAGLSAETDPFYFSNPNAYYNSTTLPAFVDTNETTRVDELFANTSNWNTAFGWGDHALAGYLTSETDPNYFSNPYSYYNITTLTVTESQISDLDHFSTADEIDPVWTADSTNYYNKSEVDDLLLSVTFYPTSVSVETGTVNSGENVGNISFDDEQILNVSEVAPAGMLIYINFTGVNATPDFITMSHQYDGSHQMHLDVWDYNSSSWETYDDIFPQASLIKDNIAIIDGNNHVSGELVQMRFIHVGTGNINDDFFLDFINLVSGSSTLTTTEHDGLSGRGDILNNHPNIESVFYTETEIDGFNYYNATDFAIADYYLKSNPFSFYNVSTLTVTESQISDLAHTTDTNETTKVAQIKTITDNFAIASSGNQNISIVDKLNGADNWTEVGFTISGSEAWIDSISSNYFDHLWLNVTGETSEEVFMFKVSHDSTTDHHFVIRLANVSHSTYSDVYHNLGDSYSIMFDANANNMKIREYNQDGTTCNVDYGTSASFTASQIYDLKIEVDGTKGAKYYYKTGSDNEAITDTGWTLLKDSTSTGDNDGCTRSDDGLKPWFNGRNVDTGILVYYVNYTYETLVATPLSLNQSLDVDGEIFADDFVTKSKVPIIDGTSALTHLDNIENWTKDGKIQYKEHYANKLMKKDKKLKPIYETTCEDQFNIINLTMDEVCTTDVIGYTEESVEKYGLSMETRVAEMEKMIYELYIEVWKLK